MSPEKAEQIAKAIGVPAGLLIRLSIEENLRGRLLGRTGRAERCCGRFRLLHLPAQLPSLNTWPRLVGGRRNKPIFPSCQNPRTGFETPAMRSDRRGLVEATTASSARMRWELAEDWTYCGWIWKARRSRQRKTAKSRRSKVKMWGVATSSARTTRVASA